MDRRMVMSNRIRLSGIAYESLVNGPGLRRVFFSQGCIHNCKGCFNQETHSFNEGVLMDMDVLIEDVYKNPMIKGITFSGGDPFERAKEFAYMAKAFRKIDLNIWCYTGYLFEELLEKNDSDTLELLRNIDVLVDGKFDINKTREGLKYRGSYNQRIIDVKKTLENNKIIEIEY